MIVLSTVNDIIRVVTTSANALDAHVSFADNTAAAYTPSRQNAAIAVAATTTVCAAPAAATQRHIKHASFRAKGGANTLTVQFFDGATAFELASVALGVGEQLVFTDPQGWAVLDAAGGLKMSTSLAPIAANSVLANATAATAVPTAVAIGTESILGRSSGNITTFASAVQQALIRAAGSLFFATAAAGQHLRRSLAGGDLGFSALEVGTSLGSPIVANAAVTNAVTNVSCTGSLSLPAGSSIGGTTLVARGWFSHVRVATAQTLIAELLVNGAVVATATLASPTIIATMGGCVDAILTVRTTGVGGTAMAQLHFDSNFSTANSIDGSVNTATFAIDTTVARTVELRMRMSAAIAATTLTVTNGYIERFN